MVVIDISQFRGTVGRVAQPYYTARAGSDDDRLRKVACQTPAIDFNLRVPTSGASGWYSQWLRGENYRPPAPYTARPGVAPECSPSRQTRSPFTQTWRTPTASW